MRLAFCIAKCKAAPAAQKARAEDDGRSYLIYGAANGSPNSDKEEKPYDPAANAT